MRSREVIREKMHEAYQSLAIRINLKWGPTDTSADTYDVIHTLRADGR